MAKKKDTTQDSTDGVNNDFDKRYSKVLSPEWMDEYMAHSTDDIKKNMIEFEQVISVSEKDCKADSEINGIKARIKDLKDELKEKEGVYSDSINIAYAKIRYAVHVLESRGITLERNNS